MGQVADYVLQRLTEWGIHRIYGYPGTGSTASSARWTGRRVIRS